MLRIRSKVSTSLLVGVAAAALLSGCGSASSSSPSSTSSGSGSATTSSAGATSSTYPIGTTVVWKGTTQITGAASSTDSFTATEDLTSYSTGAKYNCAYAASHTDEPNELTSASPTFDIPQPASGQGMMPVGSAQPSAIVGIQINNYKGSGTYTEASGGGGGVSVGADVKSGNFTYWLDSGNGSTWKLVTNADGSGTFTFAGAYGGTSSTPNGQTISGTVNWTCENAS
jgi:hypothetical protein